MKKISILVIALSIIIAAGCNKSTDSRRYELSSSVSGNHDNWIVKTYVIDTYTGNTWLFYGLNLNHRDSSWIFLGNPASVK
jgi:hypothetical protein